jgi:MFS family permease
VPLIGLVPVLHALGVLSFPLLVGLVFLHGAFWPTYSASQAALLPALAGDDQGRLTRASALFQAVTRLTLLAGPALAGVLIGWLGPTTVLLLDAATYLVAFLLVAGCIPADDRAPAAEPVRGMLAGVRSCWATSCSGPGRWRPACRRWASRRCCSPCRCWRSPATTRTLVWPAC